MQNELQIQDQSGNSHNHMLCSGFLAPYFPYDLRLIYKDCQTLRKRKATLTAISKIDIETTYKKKINGCSGDLIGWTGHNNVSEMQVKLILKPFEDYSKILEITDEMNDYEIQMIEDNPDMIKRLGYDVIEKMLKHHIDIFGLINKRLAVSIHDVE